MPIIGAGTTSRVLSSTEDYPLFQRVIQSDIFSATIMAEFIENLGWKNVALIYDSEAYAASFGEKLQAELSARNIHIVNGPESRMVDTVNLGEITDDIIHPIVTEIWESEVRAIITIFSYISGDLLDDVLAKFLDLGADAGDLFFIVNESLNFWYLNSLE